MIYVILYGDQFAATAGDGLPTISAAGPHCVATLAQQLLNAGIDPDRELAIHRGGQRTHTTTIREATAQGHTNDDMEGSV